MMQSNEDDSSDTEPEEWSDDEEMDEKYFNVKTTSQDSANDENQLNKIGIRQRILQLLQQPDMKYTGHHINWMTRKHKEHLVRFTPFGDQEMDSLMRDVLKRHDSMSSLAGVQRNLIDVIFTREKAKTMTTKEILETPVFFKIWKFVTQSDLSNSKHRDAFSKSVHRLLKRKRQENITALKMLNKP